MYFSEKREEFDLSSLLKNVDDVIECEDKVLNLCSSSYVYIKKIVEETILIERYSEVV